MATNSGEVKPRPRAAVIGLGSMGVHHARVYSEMPSVDLVAVADIKQTVADGIAAKYSCTGYGDVADLLRNEQVDVASISVPTPHHAETAQQLIDAGVNVLIEKPITTTVDEAQALIEAAKANGVSLGVGHIERFNPVILGLKALLDSGDIGDILQISVQRIGPRPDSDRGTGVFLDLATHDIDIVRFLTGSEVSTIASLWKNVTASQYEDLGAGLLSMDDGTLVIITENWVSPTKVREITVTGVHGLLVADTLTQDLFQFDNDYTTSEWASILNFRGTSEGRMIRHRLTKDEPLRLELDSWVESITNDTKFGVSGEDGLAALKIALQLRDGANNGGSG